MAVSDRPYMRLESGFGPPDVRTWTSRITIAGVVAMLALMAAREWFQMRPEAHLALSPNGFQSGALWTLLTYPFAARLGWSQIVAFIAFWFFGHMAEDRVGRSRYLLLLMLSVVSGGAVHLAAQAVPTLSRLSDFVLSGFGVVNAACVLAVTAAAPTHRLDFGFFRIPMWGLAATWFGADVLIATGSVQGATSQLFGHIGAAAFAFAAVWFAWLPTEPFAWMRRKRRLAPPRDGGDTWYGAKSPPRDAPRTEGRAEQGTAQPRATTAAERERVDALLEKISRSGVGSLTEEERTFLNEASKRYR